MSGYFGQEFTVGDTRFVATDFEVEETSDGVIEVTINRKSYRPTSGTNQPTKKDNMATPARLSHPESFGISADPFAAPPRGDVDLNDDPIVQDQARELVVKTVVAGKLRDNVAKLGDEIEENEREADELRLEYEAEIARLVVEREEELGKLREQRDALSEQRGDYDAQLTEARKAEMALKAGLKVAAATSAKPLSITVGGELVASHPSTDEISVIRPTKVTKA